MSTEDLDTVYSERNRLAIAFVRAALALGWKAGRGHDRDPDKDWEPEWRHVLYVVLPDGKQVSWHMSPAELPLLYDIPQTDVAWDGTYTAREHRWCLFGGLG